MLRKLTIFIFLLTGFAWSFSVSAATCPMDNGAGVGCNAGNNEYYCGSACRQLSAGTTPTLNFCQNNFQVCAPGVDCSNSYAAAFPCGVPQACNSGYTLCNIAGNGASSFPNSKCKANVVVPTGCSSYNQCTSVCSACSAGYELLAGTCVGATVKLGTDSVMSDRLKNSTMPLMSILSSGNVGIGATDPNDIFSIGNAGSAPAGSSNTGHNYTSTYLSADDYALVNYGLVKTLINSSASSTALFGGSLTGNIWNLNSGNVGIGTTNPGAKLEIQNITGDLSTPLVFSNAGTVDKGAISSFSNTNGTGFLLEANRYINSSGSAALYNTAHPSWELRLDARDNVDSFWVGRAASGVNSLTNFLTIGNTGITTLSQNLIVSGTGNTTIAGNVGIGTTTPATKLNVFGDARFGDSINYTNINSTGDLSLAGSADYLVDGNRYAFRYSGSENYGLYFDFTNDEYAFRTYDASKIFSINADNGNTYVKGNLGIGAPTVNDKFSIANSGAAPTGSVNTGHNYTSTYLTDDNYALTNYGIVKSLISTSATANALWNGTKNGNIYNGDAGAGNVGIGTTAPGAKLDVDGIVRISGDATHYAELSQSTGNGMPLSLSFSKPGGEYGSYLDILQSHQSYGFLIHGTTGIGGGTTSWGGQGLDASGNLGISLSATTKDMIFYGGNFGSEIMRMKGTGNVGIGITNPASKLSIISSETNNAIGTFGSRIYASKAISAADGNQNAGLSVQYNTQGTSDFTNMNSAIAGAAYNGTSGTLSIQNALWFIIGNSGAGTIGNVSERNGVLITNFSTGAGGLAGTVSNSNGLHVSNMAAYNSPTNTNGLLIDDSTNAVGTYKYGVKIGDMSGATNNFALSTGLGTVYFGDNVGVGTSVPNDIFSIGNSGSAPIGSDHTGHNYTMSYLTSDPYALVNYGTTMSLINAATSSSSLWSGAKNGNIWNGDAGAGNVGIGTTAPTTNLQVNGSYSKIKITDPLTPTNNVTIGMDESGAVAYPYIAFNQSSPTVSNASFWANGQNSIFNTPSSPMYFRVGNAGRMAMTSDGLAINTGNSGPGAGNGLIVGSGNVGIGTTTPAVKLAVEGVVNIGSSGINGGLNIYKAGTANPIFSYDPANGNIKGSSGYVNWQPYNPGTADNTFVISHSTVGNFVWRVGMNINDPTVLPELMRLTHGGNLGIGTTAPNDIFSIGNAGSAPSGSSNTGHNYTSTYLSADDYALVNYGLVKTLIDSANSSSALFGGTLSGDIWNLNSGNIGLGTTTPAAKLDLVGLMKMRVATSSITQAEDVVNKGYLDYKIGSANTVGKYAGVTVATYSGNNSALGVGYDKANDQCATDVPGSHVCATSEILNTIASKGAMPTDSIVWVFNGPPGYTVEANDCDGRASNRTTSYGAVWQTDISKWTNGRGMLTTCNNSNKFACCK